MRGAIEAPTLPIIVSPPRAKFLIGVGKSSEENT